MRRSRRRLLRVFNQLRDRFKRAGISTTTQLVGVPAAGVIAPVSVPAAIFHDIMEARALPPVTVSGVPPVHPVGAVNAVFDVD